MKVWLSLFVAVAGALAPIHARAGANDPDYIPLVVETGEPTDDGSGGTLGGEFDIGPEIVNVVGTATANFGQSDAGPPWNLNFLYANKKAISGNPDGGTTNIVDVTNQYNGGMGWTGASGWGLAFTVDYEMTPAEMLVTRGSTVALSHKWVSESKEDYSPYVNVSLNGGASNFVESFNGTVTSRTRRTITIRPISGTNELRESYGGIDATWSNVSALEYMLGFKLYGFNRNVGDFIAFLDSPLAVQRNMGGLSGTVSGFPSASYTGNLAWNFAEEYKLNLNESVSTIVVTGQVEFDTKVTLESEFFKNFRGTVGYERDISPSANTWDFIMGLTWVL